ncbi:acylphosphatase [Mesorhizobium xinjiangense]|uniref:acylphosphatase n=1 Tax=Mesorhizobium xinjiangense TaxID=2678685 RepID=UPI0012EDA0C6|nr:acylphosphatase [Mesorhizobium xinjiangense]
MTKSRRALLVRVTGRVQGVSFRYWTMKQAEALGLAGWVRNEPDGSVRALLVGPQGKVSEMVDRLWKGPPAARVTGVVAEQADGADVPAGFDIVS